MGSENYLHPHKDFNRLLGVKMPSDIEALFAILAGTSGLLLAYAKWRSFLPVEKSRLKQDLEILKLLQETNQKSSELEAQIEKQHHKIYLEEVRKKSPTLYLSLALFLLVINIFFVFMSYDFYQEGGVLFMLPPIILLAINSHTMYDYFKMYRVS